MITPGSFESTFFINAVSTVTSDGDSTCTNSSSAGHT